jgi:hypothetical protein
MKKLLLIFALSIFSTATIANVNFVGISYSFYCDSSCDGNNGYNLSYSGVKDRLGVSAEHNSKDGMNADTTSYTLRYALTDSFSEGSPYIAAVHLNHEGGSTDSVVKFGYAKVTGEGIDYDFSHTFTENEIAENSYVVTSSASLRIALQGDLGLSVGVDYDGDIARTSLGVDLKF